MLCELVMVMVMVLGRGRRGGGRQAGLARRLAVAGGV